MLPNRKDGNIRGWKGNNKQTRTERIETDINKQDRNTRGQKRLDWIETDTNRKVRSARRYGHGNHQQQWLARYTNQALKLKTL